MPSLSFLATDYPLGNTKYESTSVLSFASTDFTTSRLISPLHPQISVALQFITNPSAVSYLPYVLELTSNTASQKHLGVKAVGLIQGTPLLCLWLLAASLKAMGQNAVTLPLLRQDLTRKLPKTDMH